MLFRVIVGALVVSFVTGCHGVAGSRPRPTGATVARAEASPRVPNPSLPESWRYAHPLAVQSQWGMVVTDCTLATEVGKDVLSAGGNAVDAAVAVAFALAVAYPTAGNLGGGGFALAHVYGESRALDFREVAPGSASRDMYLDQAGNASADSQTGLRSAGVPGTVAGLWELHRVLGSHRMKWAELVEPSVRLAREGFVVDEEFERGLVQVADRLKRFPSSSKLYFPSGTVPTRGSRWRNPELARVLEQIANEGRDGFYRGSAASAIAAQMIKEHGFITQSDLERYQPKWRTPLRFGYRDATVVTMPPPSSGGITLAMTANILAGFDLRQFGFGTPQSLHLVIEALRRAFASRNSRIGDPDFVTVPIDELLGKAWAEKQRATIERDRATPSDDIASAPDSGGNGPHTTHLAVADGLGNVVSLTTTLNFSYGSGVVVEGAGFVLNNEMDDFSAAPGRPNGFGLVQGEANAIAPFKRMLSSMSPSIVFGADSRIRLVVGAAGGPTIISTVFQEISNVADYGLDAAAAVGAPRLHMQHLPDVVTIEQGGFSAETLHQLEAMGHHIKPQPQLADAPLIGRLGSFWVGVAEPRRKGGLAAAPNPLNE